MLLSVAISSAGSDDRVLNEVPVNKALRVLLTGIGITVLAILPQEEIHLQCHIQHLGPVRSKRPTAGAVGPRGGLGHPDRWRKLL